MIGTALVQVVLTLILLLLVRKLVVDKASVASRQLRELRTELTENLKHTHAGLSGDISLGFAEVSALRAQIADLTERAERSSGTLEDLWTTVSALPGEYGKLADAAFAELPKQLSGLSEAVSAGVAGVSALHSQVTGLTERADRSAETLASLWADVSELRGQCSKLTDTLESSRQGTPPTSFPIDRDALRQTTEPEMIAIAESVATVRPLVPYPNWRFDAEWSNPDLAFQLRQSIWQYFNDRPSETPIVIGWHYGTRLALHLGNDVSRQIYIAGCIDPNEFAFLDRFLRPGMTFVDAGANEGIYSVFAGNRLGSDGTVWAFEPSGREIVRLQRNVDLNGLRVRIFPVALADRECSAELNVAAYEHSGQNTLGAFAYDIELAEKQMIKMVRLDDLVAQNPLGRLDLIKVDVEGAETRLFRGATETLQRYRPVLLFEVLDAALRSQGSNTEELLDFLRDQEYNFFGFSESSGMPIPITATADGNIIAVPNERALPETVFRPWPAALLTETENEKIEIPPRGSPQTAEN